MKSRAFDGYQNSKPISQGRSWIDRSLVVEKSDAKPKKFKEGRLSLRSCEPIS